MIPDCTLVTACFDLTKYNKQSRSFEDSINKISSLLETPCYLIIFTDKNLYTCIKNKRNEFNLDNLTHYIVTDVENLDTFKYLEQVNNLTKELNEYKIENFSKKNYYQKNKEKIIEMVKEYND